VLNDLLLGLLFDPEDRSDPSILIAGFRVIYSSEYCIIKHVITLTVHRGEVIQICKNAKRLT
jgi:hypothetical protein